MPILLLLLLGTAVEITVLIAIGSVIGVLPTIALVVLATVIGVALLRREGTRTLMSFRDKVRSGQPPQAEMLDGVLISAAAVLIILPGFISDLLAIALLFPPTRRLIRNRIWRRVEARARRSAGEVFIIDAQP
ncbi:FxsA family protein [Actinocrispum wychmicini]|uniref:UPF0716 protein FxsA n=1 Tax=Actinocrispum wychmicini TaxID=1213861 RepID=A0A4R2ITJ2_9PSEU|nr:FxsA family protein [Actinocrispum wychmicini]TCO48821.1 UPF0716 protein FxsA [Actinocrispum wychmicini]